MTLHIATPLLDSPALEKISGRKIWLKMESSQPSGSFKNRGVGLVCETRAAEGAKRFVSSSGGNAGLAVAYAGRRLGLPVVVFVPQTASERAKALLRLEGAEVVVHGPSWKETHELALSRLGPEDAFIHPFDDPLLWQGHATLIDEVAAAGVKPDAVILSVGGGGLLCGIVEGLRRNGWADTPVLAVETQGADSLARSIAEDRRIELAEITSLATTLGAKQVAEQAFAWTRAHDLRSIVVSDRAAVSACRRFLEDHRTLVEPACGASLSLAYDASPALTPFASVLIVVCGGATATTAQLEDWAAKLG